MVPFDFSCQGKCELRDSIDRKSHAVFGMVGMLIGEDENDSIRFNISRGQR